MNRWQRNVLVILGILLCFGSSLTAAMQYDSTEITLGGTYTFVEGDPDYLKSVSLGIQPIFGSTSYPNDFLFISMRYFYNFDSYSNLFDFEKPEYLHTAALSVGIENKKGMASLAFGAGAEVDLLHTNDGITLKPSVVAHVTPRVFLPLGKLHSVVLAPEIVGRYVFDKDPAFEVEARVALGIRFGSAKAKTKAIASPPSSFTATAVPLVPKVATIKSTVAKVEAQEIQTIQEEVVQPTPVVLATTTTDPEVRQEQIQRLWWLLGGRP